MEPSHLPCSSLTHPAAILTPSIGVLRWIRAKDEERKAFIIQYSQIREEAERIGAKIFFVDEAHFRADADLRGK